MAKVTDPNLIAQLEAQPVFDPEVVSALDGQGQSSVRAIAGAALPGVFALSKGSPENVQARQAYQTLTTPLLDPSVSDSDRSAALDVLPASGLLIGTAPSAPGPMTRGPVRSLLRRGAEAAAVRSTNAERTALDRATKGNEAARHDIGAFLLDEKIPLRSPQTMKAGAQDVAKDAGQEIGDAVKVADATGATVDLAGAIQDAKSSRAVSRLSRNTKTRAAYNDVVTMLDDQFQRLGGRIKPSEAHDLRMQLDELADWDKAAPAGVKKAWRSAREAVDSALADAMDGTGQGAAWAEANDRFAMSRKLTNPGNRGLADVGVKRREGNRMLGPTEQGSVLLGGGVAAIDPLTGMAIPAVTLAAKRFGMPVAARLMDWAGQPVPSLSALPGQAAAPVTRALPEVESALARAMTRLRVANAGANEEER